MVGGREVQVESDEGRGRRSMGLECPRNNERKTAGP